MDFEGAHDVRSPRRLGAAIGMMVLALSLGACSRSLVGISTASKDTKAPAKTAAATSTKPGAAGEQGDGATGGGATGTAQTGAESKPLSPSGEIAADADGAGSKGATAGAAGANADGTAAAGQAGAAGSNASGATAGAGAAGAAGAAGKGSTGAAAGGAGAAAGAAGKPGAAAAGTSAGAAGGAGAAGAAGARKTPSGGSDAEAAAAAKGGGDKGRTSADGAGGATAAGSDPAEEALRAEQERAAALEAERRGRVETAANRVVIDQDEKLQTLGGTLPATFNMDEKGQFEFDRYTLSAEVKAKLDEIGDKLKDAPYDRLIVHGYTDRIGTDEYNQELSEKRAWAVAGYLMDKGVPPYKLTVVGRGKTAPLTTPEECKGLKRDALIDCLQRDRRVEVVATLKEYNLKVQ